MIKRILNSIVRVVCKCVPRRLRSAIATQVKQLADAEQSRQTARESLLTGRTVVSVETQPDNETQMILKLAESFNSARQRQSSVSREYLPSHDWEKSLEAEWHHYYDSLSGKDIGSLAHFLRNFFRNEGVSGLWGDTQMFETFRDLGKGDALWRERMMLKQYAVWRAAFPRTSVAVLDAPRIGNPWGYDFSGFLLLEPVFEYHLQADYFRSLLYEIQSPVILEIGGGFGGLAYHLLRLGGPMKYIGLDLPENLLLQSYYLSCAFPSARILTYDKEFSRLDQTTINNYDIILLPNFVLPDIESSIADLIVNIRSLSEMSSETIGEYLNQIDRIGRLFFFHENISAPRQDGLSGIPSTQFPPLGNFSLIASFESRWPKYKMGLNYPCHENLFIRRDVIQRSAKPATNNSP